MHKASVDALELRMVSRRLVRSGSALQVLGTKALATAAERAATRLLDPASSLGRALRLELGSK